VASVSSALVNAYWRYQALYENPDPTVRRDAARLFWAWERVNDAVLDGDAGIIELIVALADAAPNDRAACYLGCGPLEDLIRLHGADFADAIDAAARRNPRFQTALRCVWYDSEEDPELVARFQRFGPPP